MDWALGALKHVLIIAALVGGLHWLGEWAVRAIRRVRIRRYVQRQGRKHVRKLNDCKAVIRDYQAGDEKAVLSLVVENAATDGAQLDRDFLVASLRDPLLVRHLFVAELDNRIVGYANLQIVASGMYLASAQVADLYVRPEDRRQGIGSALVQRLARRAHAYGFAVVNISYAQENQQASEFFSMAGAFAGTMAHRLMPTIPGEVVARETESDTASEPPVFPEQSDVPRTLH